MSDRQGPAQQFFEEAVEELTPPSEYYVREDKARKKRLKKERQKDKRNAGRAESGPVEDVNKSGPVEDVNKSAPSDDVNKSERASRQRRKETTDEPEPVDSGSEMDTENMSDAGDSDSSDINFENIETAFIRSIISQKDIVKQRKKRDTIKVKEIHKDANHKPDTIFPDNEAGFTRVKKGSKQAPKALSKTPEGFGNEALRVIRDGNFELAIHYLNRAIALEPTDSRHYINRSYCYLRIAEYAKALSDIKYASEHLSDLLEMSRAKCREGQALCGLQDYEAAELAFRESINFAPNCFFAKRELKRMQIRRIVDMGFKERDALMALETKPSTREAINLLSDESLTNTAAYESAGSLSENDDDEIFLSDTEEDPSNERLLSRLLKYDPDMPEEPLVPEPPPKLKEAVYNYNTQPPRAVSQERTLRIIKAVPVVAKPKKTNQGINEMAVWVGSLTSLITDAMLQKRFSKFGKVTSVKRPLNDAYAFVNFQCPTSTQKALEEASYNGGCIDMNGSRLVLKQATVKTFH